MAQLKTLVDEHNQQDDTDQVGTQAFRHALRDIFAIEGGFSDHESDPGGRTRWGITKEKARSHGYEGPVDELPRELALGIYYEDYWAYPETQLGRIQQIGGLPFATNLLEFGINTSDHGSTSIEALQRALNLMNKQGTFWRDIETDGVTGEDTLKALASLVHVRGDRGVTNVQKVIDGLQVEHYVTIAEANEELEDFFYGWVNQRV